MVEFEFILYTSGLIELYTHAFLYIMTVSVYVYIYQSIEFQSVNLASNVYRHQIVPLTEIYHDFYLPNFGNKVTILVYVCYRMCDQRPTSLGVLPNYITHQ